MRRTHFFAPAPALTRALWTWSGLPPPNCLTTMYACLDAVVVGVVIPDVLASPSLRHRRFRFGIIVIVVILSPSSCAAPSSLPFLSSPSSSFEVVIVSGRTPVAVDLGSACLRRPRSVDRGSRCRPQGSRVAGAGRAITSSRFIVRGLRPIFIRLSPCRLSFTPFEKRLAFARSMRCSQGRGLAQRGFFGSL